MGFYVRMQASFHVEWVQIEQYDVAPFIYWHVKGVTSSLYVNAKKRDSRAYFDNIFNFFKFHSSSPTPYSPDHSGLNFANQKLFFNTQRILSPFLRRIFISKYISKYIFLFSSSMTCTTMISSTQFFEVVEWFECFSDYLAFRVHNLWW